VNVTIDVGDDGVIDWDYSVYHSDDPVVVDSVFNAWSDNPNNANIFFVDMVDDTDIINLVSLGRVQNNDFAQANNVDDGILGMTSVDAFSNQMMSITTDNGSVHAFTPSVFAPFTFVGLYVAEGGSTYYCNSDHELSFISECDLTPQQAMVPAHLAREANASEFMHTEHIMSQQIIDTVNEILDDCVVPCNITIRVTSDAVGKVQLTRFIVMPPGPPPNVTAEENAADYHIEIAGENITNVSYFYGVMPNVYMVPVIAGDDNESMTSDQYNRLSMLNKTLVEAWDNLTNNSHPMNFTFYMNPYVLVNYSLGESRVRFDEEVWDDLLPNFPMNDPAILVVIDVKDYFPNDDPSNERRAPGQDFNLISRIYVNGFSDSNDVTDLYRYNDELLRNIVLHELVHTFVDYPPVDQRKLFHSNHPASFTDLAGFPTYDPSESPDGDEGYYELYSIMNQIRVYIADEDVGMDEMLSHLDMMLLGTLSPHTEGNYTFYSATVSDVGDRYQATGVSESSYVDLNNVYNDNTDSFWWDVRVNSTPIGMGNNTSFDVPKQGQAGRALWVFADDIAHEDHFKVFNFNSGSLYNWIPLNDTGRVRATHDFIGNYSEGDNNTVECSFSYPIDRTLGSLGWVPELPDGWNVTNVSGDGNPEYDGNMIVFLSGVLPNPIEFNYTILVPAGENGTKNITDVVEYHYEGEINPNEMNATPNPLVVNEKLCNPIWILNDTWSECNIQDLQFKNYYDTRECGDPDPFGLVNQTCNYCSYNLTYTNWTIWQNNTQCRVNDTIVQNRSRVEYDMNYETCYLVTFIGADLWNNLTHWESRVEDCDFCTPELVTGNWTDWYNISACRENDQYVQRRDGTQYDNNSCGEVNSSSVTEYRTPDCDFCTPELVNTTWSDWYNTTACRENDTWIEKRMKTQFDNNSCGEIVDSVFFETQEGECDYCTQDLVNSSVSEWENMTACRDNETLVQRREIVQYDNNSCGETENQTFYEYQQVSCELADSDGDGLPDIRDNVYGNASDVDISDSDIEMLFVEIGGDDNLSQYFISSQTVVFMTASETVMEFVYTFPNGSVLNLSDIKIMTGSDGDDSYIVIKGIELMDNETKTVYFDRVNDDADKVCIEDKEIASVSAMSSGCTGAGETELECDGNIVSGYSCIIENGRYKITGLEHSGVKEFEEAAVKKKKGGGGGGGGGGSSKNCWPQWECTEWSECINGYERRECTDKNDCGKIEERPETELRCSLSFVPDGFGNQEPEFSPKEVEKPRVEDNQSDEVADSPITGSFVRDLFDAGAMTWIANIITVLIFILCVVIVVRLRKRF